MKYFEVEKIRNKNDYYNKYKEVKAMCQDMRDGVFTYDRLSEIYGRADWLDAIKREMRAYTHKKVTDLWSYSGEVWRVEMPETVKSKAEAVEYYWCKLDLECCDLIHIGCLHNTWFAWVTDGRKDY